MRLVGAMAGLWMLLYGGVVVAAPQLEYMISGIPDGAGVTSGRKAWELRESLSKYFNYRLGANDQSAFHYLNEEWMVHNLTTEDNSVSLLVDWHPLAGRLRFSGGIVSYKRVFNYVAAPTVDETFRDQIFIDPQAMVDDLVSELQEKGITVDPEDLAAYLPEDMPSAQVIKIKQRIEINAEDLSAHARVRYKNVAPYMGLGWSSPFSRHNRLRYSLDLGVMRQVDPHIELMMQGDALEGAKPAVQTWVNEWVFEQKMKLYKKLDQRSLSPRLVVGLSYRFY
jgi:hypothetical protein